MFYTIYDDIMYAYIYVLLYVIMHACVYQFANAANALIVYTMKVTVQGLPFLLLQ